MLAALLYFGRQPQLMAKTKNKTPKKSMEESLWDSANKLRGKVESSEYKHVVLALIFLKFASDKFRQYGSRVFRSIWRGLKTKKAVWDAVRTVFRMVTATSIDDCHKVLSIHQSRMIQV